MGLATPPRAYSDRNEPIFWTGDAPVLMFDAPQPGSATMVAFKSGTNSHSASVQATEGSIVLVSVRARDAGLARLCVAGEQSANVDLAYIQRPSVSALRELLGQTARLRIQIGQQQIEAWQNSTHNIRLLVREQPEVRVDLGDETARARVTVWGRGKHRSRRGLDWKGVSRAVEDALAGAERLEIDAGNLGRVVILILRVSEETIRRGESSDRLTWHDHIVSMGELAEKGCTPAILKLPRQADSFVPRQVSPAVLVRSRMALRRRVEAEGRRS
ncbi:hypothetical protein POL68_37865 [Stigmatella sp. ncwal1]|uniref:Uncharacterized protein n=1 Tax=Stigmatella ashevillensis TaxID=2995309 RepID=A0ABT5DMB6_9BACT|nr:hypothetical protein [Stigmatella ashevillena]MDC0714290.1 hypothetical protein [Stigmatella ashevillena]